MMTSGSGNVRGVRDPVFVRATGAGTGGIATLILDGDGFMLRLDAMLRSKPKLRDATTGDLLYGKFHDSFGRFIDEVIAAPISSKSSTTGNQQVELSCHGGLGAVAAVEAALLEAGFAQGRATELLERAHLNGLLSLIAMEAQLRLAKAMTERQAQFLLGHEALQKKWERHGFDMAMGLRTRELGWRETLFNHARQSLEDAKSAAALLRQHRVAIVGPVNAGKSTLANALARSDRHIVSPIPGTTLDVLETAIDLRGLHVLLMDTAGRRSSSDELEAAGQGRAERAAASANLRICLLDGSHAPADEDVALLQRLTDAGPTLLVLNKSDLGVSDEGQGLSFIAGRDAISISAQTGAGIPELEQAIERTLLNGGDPEASMPFTRRQTAHIEAIRSALQQGVEGTEFLIHVRRLIGTRPDIEEMSVVLDEANT
ncbi:MAG TPA: GTPase [Planctomycetota bacterium]|nr:GTPase [Planctomycetota bacterium]